MRRALLADLIQILPTWNDWNVSQKIRSKIFWRTYVVVTSVISVFRYVMEMRTIFRTGRKNSMTQLTSLKCPRWWHTYLIHFNELTENFAAALELLQLLASRVTLLTNGFEQRYLIKFEPRLHPSWKLPHFKNRRCPGAFPPRSLPSTSRESVERASAS